MGAGARVWRKGKAAKAPPVIAALDHLLLQGRLSAGLPAQKAPHEVGSWPSARGLRGSAARRRSMTSRFICQIYRMKFVRLSFSATGAAMPAALPASMHLSIHAMLRPRLRMICRPSSSARTSSALPPWTIGQ